MKKRQWAIVGGLLVLMLAFLAMRQLGQSSPKKAERRSQALPAVSTTTIVPGKEHLRIPIDGPLQAAQKLELYAEVTGVMLPGSHPFETGVAFAAGETFLRIESAEAEASYQSAYNQFLSGLSRALPDIQLDYPRAYPTWRQYLDEVTLAEGLPPAPAQAEDPALRLFLTSQGIYRDYQNLRSASVRLAKHRLKAPFDGVLTEAQVEIGTLVRPGQPLGEFIAPGRLELSAALSPGNLAYVSIGDSVYLRGAGMETWGTLSRINAKVESSTQRNRIFVDLQDSRFRDGQYLRGEILGKTLTGAFSLPRNLLVGKNQVYLVKEGQLQLAELEVLYADLYRVIARGLPAGTQVAAKPIPGAYPGMPVKSLKP